MINAVTTVLLNGPFEYAINSTCGEARSSSPVVRGGQIADALIRGAGKGFLTYLSGRIVSKLPVVHGLAQLISPNPIANILVGIASAAILEIAYLVHDLGKGALGERPSTDSQNPNAKEWIRQKTWNVVSHLEQIPRKVDAIFSRLLGIRTLDETQALRDKPQTLSLFENGRCILLDTINKIAANNAPKWISDHFIESFGYDTRVLPIKFKLFAIMHVFIQSCQIRMLEVQQSDA